MPHVVDSETIHTLEDLESACRRWRPLAGKDAAVVIDFEFTSNVVMTLRKHDISERFSLSLEKVETGWGK